MARADALFFAFGCFLLLTPCAGDADFFENIPKELRCSGCELMIKVMDQILAGNSKGSIEFRTKNAIDAVCEKERFDISEYKSSVMADVCSFIRKKHRSELMRELVKHYSHQKRSTYLEFVQHMCLDVLRFCAGVSHKSKDREGETYIHFDSDTHGYTVVPGHNIKLPDPVKEEL